MPPSQMNALQAFEVIQLLDSARSILNNDALLKSIYSCSLDVASEAVVVELGTPLANVHEYVTAFRKQ